MRPRRLARTGRRPALRAGALLSTLLLATLTLSSCDRSEVALTINADGTVDGSAYLAVLSTYPDLGQLVRSTSGHGALDPFDTLPGSDIEPYRSGGFIGEQVSFDGATWDAAQQTLAEALSAPEVEASSAYDSTPSPSVLAEDAEEAKVTGAATFTIEKVPSAEAQSGESSGGVPQVRFSGTNPGLDELVDYVTAYAATAAAGSSIAANPVQMNLVVTFPGRVLSTNGDQTGNTVTWTFDRYQELDGNIEAVAEIPPATGVGFRETVRLKTLDVIDWAREHLPAVGFVLVALLAGLVLLRIFRAPKPVTVPVGPSAWDDDHDPHRLLITDEEFARPQLVLIDGSPVAFDEPQPDDFLAPVPTEPSLVLVPSSYTAADADESPIEPGEEL